MVVCMCCCPVQLSNCIYILHVSVSGIGSWQQKSTYRSFGSAIKRDCLCLLCVSVAHQLVVCLLSFSQLPSRVVSLGTGRVLRFNTFPKPRAGHLESNPRIKSSHFQALLDAAFRKLYNTTCYSRGHASNVGDKYQQVSSSCRRSGFLSSSLACGDYHASSATLKFWSVNSNFYS